MFGAIEMMSLWSLYEVIRMDIVVNEELLQSMLREVEKMDC